MIAIQGVKISHVQIEIKDDEDKITGDYLLMSNGGKVLAKQGFNGYSAIVIGFSADTIGAYNKFMEGVKSDVQKVLGLEETK
jgi:hypothetical protein